MFSYILFDLDGTISDPKQGICTCVQYALMSFGISEPDINKLTPFIGPPLRDSFMQFYDFTPQQAELAVEKYRERFSVCGKFENTLYPGMKELLMELRRSGAHLAIASSKPTVFIEDILQYFGIRQCFEVVVGSELDGTRDKKEDVVAEVLRQFGEIMAAQEGIGELDLSRVVMIGDRKYDIEGAKAEGTHHIGVNYGYAQPGELQEAGAEIIVQDVNGLRSVLLGSATPDSAASGGNEAGNAASDGAVPDGNETDSAAAAEKPQPEKERQLQTWKMRENSAGKEGTEPDGETYGTAAEAENDFDSQTPYGSYGRYCRQGPSQQRQTPPPGSYDRYRQPGGYDRYHQQDNYDRYRQPGSAGGYDRQPRQETALMKWAKAAGICLLAMAAYFGASVLVANGTLIPVMVLGLIQTQSGYNYWVNIASAAGTFAAIVVCWAIWHKQIRLRAAKPVDKLSLMPMMVLAASVAVGMNGLLSLIELYKYSPTFQEISELQMEVPVWLGILSYGVLAPLGEEIVFRGIIYGQIRRVSNAPAAIVISAVLFGLFHGNLVQFVYALVIGLVLALVRELYGGLLYPMIFHSIANLFVYVMLDLTEFGGAFVMPVSCIVFLVISVVSLILMVKWQKQ